MNNDDRPPLQRVSATNIPAPARRIFLFFKPYGVLSQFTSEGGHASLAGYGPFPRDVYAAGRLDWDSEGLLVLTNDNELTHTLSHPRYEQPRTYWVQIERVPSSAALERLCNGVVIQGRKTKPAIAKLLENDPILPPRLVSIRFRKNVPTAWIELTLTEGRNRQVRKMTAAVGHPTLRLVRVRVGEWSIKGLAPGEFREVSMMRPSKEICESNRQTEVPG